mmetsp:Transcript_15282/g.23148  ORF Transcript_15282/g.23148 Transcript_15282/m.23148 type:complete len:467 (+) Transcript_15282:67-1467(+)
MELKTEDLVALTLLPVCIMLILVTTYFAKNLTQAWMKLIILLSYDAAAIAAIIKVVLTRTTPDSVPHILILFNLAGQLIAATGILDCFQFAYNLIMLKRLSETNMMMINMWICGALAVLSIYPFAANEMISLLEYRCISISIISTEIIGYIGVITQLIKKGLSGAVVAVPIAYYASTFLCRLGIIAGIVMRMEGSAYTATLAVHYCSVLFVAATLLIYLKPCQKAINTLSGVSTERSKKHCASSQHRYHSRTKGTLKGGRELIESPRNFGNVETLKLERKATSTDLYSPKNIQEILTDRHSRFIVSKIDSRNGNPIATPRASEAVSMIRSSTTSDRTRASISMRQSSTNSRPSNLYPRMSSSRSKSSTSSSRFSQVRSSTTKPSRLTPRANVAASTSGLRDSRVSDSGVGFERASSSPMKNPFALSASAENNERDSILEGKDVEDDAKEADTKQNDKDKKLDVVIV